MAAWSTSPNLALNTEVARRHAAGEDIVHLGFGESRLPVFAPLAERLAQGAGRSGYGPVAGAPDVRGAVAGWFDRRGVPTDPDQVVVACGSKPLLLALNHVLPGDVVLPRPAWNTYAPQAALAGKRVIGVPIPAEAGGVPDPDLLVPALRAARESGADPRYLVLTLPDNPTGSTAPPELVRALCAVARDEDLVIVSDEIYRDVLHDPATPFLSPAEAAPERTIVTTGLSKSLALGGWRIGALRVPANELGEHVRTGVVAVASEVWSVLAGPMQEVAAYAFSEPPELRARLAATNRLHGAVARAVHALAVDAGADCRPPTGAFYVYPDFEPRRAALAARGAVDSDSLRRVLLEDFGVAVLAGHLLGDDPAALRFKAATSVLYGRTPELQELAVADPDPVRLPHIDAVLSRLGDVFAKLSRL